MIRTIFNEEGAEVVVAEDGILGLHQINEHNPDLIVLDIMMPRMSGWKTLEFISQVTEAPVIILTALPEDAEFESRGLDEGAADYIKKPFQPQILVSRARAALRHREQGRSKMVKTRYKDEHLLIDLGQRIVLQDGKRVKLTKIEMKLLAYLLRHNGRVITKKEIIRAVWDEETLNRASSVHVYISRLRQKIEKDPQQPRYIQTRHGQGYRGEFSDQDEETPSD